MNTMDEKELDLIIELAHEMGWNGVNNSKCLSTFLRNTFNSLRNKLNVLGHKAVGDLPRSIPRNLDVPHPQQPKLTAQDVLEIVKTLGLKYRVGTTTASDTLIVEGQGMLTASQALDWLRKDIPRYACEEISGTTYRIALETLIKQSGKLMHVVTSSP